MSSSTEAAPTANAVTWDVAHWIIILVGIRIVDTVIGHSVSKLFHRNVLEVWDMVLDGSGRQPKG
jgi:hypothetical protein